ncbi:MAG: cytochrome c biogenesis protein CcsA [Pirellulales bacterium]
MASISVPHSATDRVGASATGSVWQRVTVALGPLASLRLTVVLFALSIALVLIGTLAQVEMDIWEVVHKFFRSWFCWVPFSFFVPRTWFPTAPEIPGGFPFVGGKLLGVGLAVNLLAAHLIRFQVQARGVNLLLGVVTTILGCLFTWLVVTSGSGSLAGASLPYTVDQQWGLMRFSLVGAAMLLIPACFWLDLKQPSTRWSMILAALVLVPAGLWGLWQGGVSPFSSSSMRILWQLAQATLAGLVLLVGCAFLFRKRAGIVLLHAGIGLLMFYEFYVDLYAVEGQMTMAEGETVNFARDIRTTELALIDSSDPKSDRVVVVPRGILQRTGERIRDERLPVDLEVVAYYPSATLITAEQAKNPAVAGDLADNPATAGVGLRGRLLLRRATTGVDTDQGVDMAAAYVTAYRKGTDESLGTFLLSQERGFSDMFETLEADGKKWQMALRFKHMYKPYQMTLVDVRKDDYVGTNIPMNYSSDVRLAEPEVAAERDVHIWMNNPLRFAGETFYQSNYFRDPSGRESSTLQVVTNTGWMIPYVSCMLVMIGLLAHFLMVLVRYLERRSRGVAGSGADTAATALPGGWWEWGATLGLLALMAGSLISGSRPREQVHGGMRLDLLGQLPVVYEGRIKPLDSLARNMLARISDRQSFKDEDEQTQPAIRWLADLIAGRGADRDHKVFRITSLEVLDALKLQRRSGFRYSLNEILHDREAFNKVLTELDQAQQVASTKKEQLTLYQRKLLELDSRLRTYQLVSAAFLPTEFPPLPTLDEIKQDQEKSKQRLSEVVNLVMQISLRRQQLDEMQPPLVVFDPAEAEGSSQGWLPFATAADLAFKSRFDEFVAAFTGDRPAQARDVAPGALTWTRILDAYATGNAKTFNETVEEYLGEIRAAGLPGVNVPKLSFEYRLEQTQPFMWCIVAYLVAVLVACSGWIVWPQGLQRASFWLLLLALGVHTFALIARIYISGRPPVTNLYSAAVFVGWGCAVIGVLIELFYGLGLGTIIGGAIGAASLIIANGLAMRGDTMAVLQAVLDTQFWLATHVVCVTLGYSATFLAGGLGVLFVAVLAVRSGQGGVLAGPWAKAYEILPRVIYGVLCFALLLSFVGTVLGGLWADDSWGRFWGWDPKENGALIIVLWNALILHARWGGMVRGPGVALLAVAGNVTTAWSMFGVNELGVGLHSYGVTEGTLKNLALFCISQLIAVGIGVWLLRRPAGPAGTGRLPTPA